MCPIWDLDWAFGYAIKPRKHFTHPTESLFVSGNSKGTAFFSRIAHDPAIQEIYKTKWMQFKAMFNSFNKILLHFFLLL